MNRDEPAIATLRQLASARRTAALATVAAGRPFVSMVPFAVVPSQSALALLVSGLAAHTRNLQREPRVCLMLVASEEGAESVHALPRVTIEGLARLLPQDDPGYADTRAAYLSRFPDADDLTRLGDFRFARIDPQEARVVGGFGMARTLPGEIVRDALTTIRGISRSGA